ncbi:MAG TPA: recombination-associated protein RdgC [Smithellaceae bacterium]|nr:recombination-associated protein RdgC [Syntrophaceae bacterium]HOH56525.1 recombination-associated protein RdgC [Smithellaceae bacterium]MBP8665998.1 recombination-associated protein RdgC [Syntrophaceae bacterium]MBP9530960.1 recombination-associated protein RdgC [Syntrophaceae bacterium]MBP9649735.1 recombination-associated protein RdgC [Syntrophaceae bacterium]
MGLIRGAFTFMQFSVDGKLPQAFTTFARSRIQGNAFREARSSTEEKRMGWVSATDVLDADFENTPFSLGDYLIFSLRIDRKVIPPKLMKVRLMEEQRRFLSEHQQTRIGKAMNEGLKEKVRLEIMTKSDPVPSFYDVLWAVGQNKVYFSSLSDKVADDFVDYFKKTFSLGLKRMAPHEHPLALKNKAKGDAPTEDFTLIGREFLTWLWFKSEERNGAIALAKTDEVQLQLLKRIALEAGEGEYSQGVVCSGLHAELKEGKEAIRQGKKVKEAGILLHRDRDEWEFNFKADAFYFQSLRMPAADPPETQEDTEGILLERIYRIENAVRTIDRLYESFLTLRFSPEWTKNEKPRLAAWLRKEQE